MSGAELASRMGLSQSRVSALEAAERDGRTTLRSLEAAAEALDCDLLYALVPRESLDAMVRRQAAVKAREEVAAVVASMQLENQQAPADVTQAQVHELADRLVDRRGLWS